MKQAGGYGSGEPNIPYPGMNMVLPGLKNGNIKFWKIPKIVNL